MANTININIKNCCCTGGGTSDGVIEVPTEILPDPTGIEGPPEGFGPPSSISDRQCKVAVFLYQWLYWWLDAAINSAPGLILTNLLVSEVPFVIRAVLVAILTPVVNAALVSIVTAGPDISDVVLGPISAVLSIPLAYSLANLIASHKFTIPVIEDVLTKIPDYEDQIICKLSQAENQSEAYAELEKVLREAEFSEAQIALVLALMPGYIFGLLYWSADWWPSFDDETLASITDTCCGLLEPGYPLLPGSVTRCNTANYVFDLLVETFGIIADYTEGYWDFAFDFQLDLEEETIGWLESGLELPPKVKATAYSLNQFYRQLARYMVSVFQNLPGGISYVDDTTFSGLVEYFGNNAESIICSLYVALNAGEASGALLDEIAAYLLTTGLSSEAQIYINGAMVGILHADGNFINILFEQDSDVLGYVGSVACDGCGWVDPGDPSDTVFDFEVSDQGWVAFEDWCYPDPQWYDYEGYPSGYWWSGLMSGTGTARLAIYYPSLVTVDDITVYARGTGNTLGHLRIYTSDDMINWTGVASVDNATANWDTPYTFEDLGIVNKYVMVQGEKFWTGANVAYRLISFHTDGA